MSAVMTRPQAADVLELHNRWRRGAEETEQPSYLIGCAIDVATEALRDKGVEVIAEMVAKIDSLNVLDMGTCVEIPLDQWERFMEFVNANRPPLPPKPGRKVKRIA